MIPLPSFADTTLTKPPLATVVFAPYDFTAMFSTSKKKRSARLNSPVQTFLLQLKVGL